MLVLFVSKLGCADSCELCLALERRETKLILRSSESHHTASIPKSDVEAYILSGQLQLPAEWIICSRLYPALYSTRD